MPARTRNAVVLLVTLAAAACSPSKGPGDDDEPPTDFATYSAREFFETTAYTLTPSAGYAFSPDGSEFLVSSDDSGVFNAYALPTAGGAPRRLTESEDNAIFALTWFPADGRLLYTYDSGGNELNHVIVREVDGRLRDLTPGDNLKASFLGWHESGEFFYLVSTERNPANFDVYRYSAVGYERELVYENPGMQVDAVSPDGRWLALSRPRTSADSDVLLVDLESDDPTPLLITPHDGNVQHAAFAFGDDSRSLVYSTNESGEFTQAWRYDIESGERSPLVEAEWDVVDVGYSHGGDFRISFVNADARNEVTVIRTADGTVADLPTLPEGDILGVRFSADDAQIGMLVSSDVSPPNVFHGHLRDERLIALTDALNPAIDPDHLVDSSVVRYASFDGLEIPAIQYRPKLASAERPVPALVWVHGGPGGQSRTGYSATLQHLVNHGYAVLAANNRGSSGYGKTFFHLDDRRHGEEDLQDIVYGRKYLESLDWVDGERVGIIGGSYGGYMVAAALAFEPEVFDVGINIFGVTNWVRTLESIPPWWEAFKEALYDEMGDPATDAERHRRMSPLFHAENIVRPLLVVQGANDPRVLQIESDELVAAVQSNEVPVEYIVFPDEGHGFRRRENRITASEAYVDFLDTYLKGSQPASD